MTKSVFISSTEKDLRNHRRAVFDAVSSMRLRAVDMKYFGSAPGGAVRTSLDELSETDFFVGILAYRYGYVPDGATKSVTEQEYDEALRRNIPRLMYLVDPQYDWEWPNKVESQEDEIAHERLKQFKARINQNEVRSLFTTPEDLARKVSADLAREILKGYRARRRSRLLVGFIVGLLMIIVLVISVGINGQDELRRLGILPPTRMPDGSFNVVVAGIGMEQSDGSLVKNKISEEVSRSVYGQVQQFEGINTSGPDDIGVQSVLESSADARRDHAQILADKLGASVVVYGYFQQRSDNISVNYVPEFYVSPEYARLQPEILISDNFGQPVQILFGSEEGPELTARLGALRLFLGGLSSFIYGRYDDAKSKFDQAIILSPQVAVLYIMAGNAAARLNNIPEALTDYTNSLGVRAQYSRGLLARGDGLFLTAVQKHNRKAESYDTSLHWPEGTTCRSEISESTPVELLLDLAQICLTEAERSSDQPPAADIDVKVPFERASVYEWRSQNGYGEFWAEAENNLRTVIALYNAAPPDKKIRIRLPAALTHGYLALLLLATTDDLARPITEFQTAIDILKLDINQSYAQPRIEIYQTQIANLQATQNGAQTP